MRSRHPLPLHLATAGLAITLGSAAAFSQNCVWDLSQSNPGMGGTVNNLLTFNGDLYATGGSFTTAGGVGANRFARWTGSGWVEAGGGIASAINDFTIGSIGGGNDLFVVGPFTTAGGVTGINRVARFDGTSFHQMGEGLGSTPSSVAIWNNELYVGGSFTATGATAPLLRIGKWTGTAWEQVGPGLGNGSVTGMTVFQGQLHLVGTFTRTGETTGWQTLDRGLARWDGTAFHNLGSGGLLHGPGESPDPATSGCAVFNVNGVGESLYVWGSFGMAGGTRVWGMARWDGTNWHDVGGGARLSNSALAAWIRSATVFDDGTGEALWIGSSAQSSSGFHYVGGTIPAAGIAKWDGTTWYSPNIVVNNNVFALRQYNDPDGRPVMWVGGQYTAIPTGTIANRIARFACDIPPPPPGCYANCDSSTVAPILNVDDFTCFINEFASSSSLPPQQQLSSYANCDESFIEPILNVDDFTCFINNFAQGCP
jgi:trimeric autotransporter adhesin